MFGDRPLEFPQKIDFLLVPGFSLFGLTSMLDPLRHESNLEVGAPGVIFTLLEVSKVDSVIVSHFGDNRDESSHLIAAKPSFDGWEIVQDWE